ncbi:MAG: hypothetical protein PHH77_07965 [Victivallaceae bacterium]|nr:hypothetical protein [Victivallaceae bacterium]
MEKSFKLLRNNKLENFIKTVLLLLAGIIIFGLVILLLPVLLLVYLFLPSRPTKTWFGTFTQTAQSRPEQPETRNNEAQIPASEDIIDVTAKEVKNNQERN